MNRFIFPSPQSSYDENSLGDQLLWIPEIDRSKLTQPVQYRKRRSVPKQPHRNFTERTRNSAIFASRWSKFPQGQQAQSTFSSIEEQMEQSYPNSSISETENMQWETGRKIPCVFIHSSKAEFFIIFYHGNGEDIGYSRSWLSTVHSMLLSCGVVVNILIVEYPGYGLCFGKPNESGVLQNAFSAYYFVRSEFEWPVDKILHWGVSIGTGPASFLASRYDCGGLILVAGYVSICEVVKHLAGKAVSFMLSDRFQNIKEMESISCPALFVHGKDDKLIPYQQSLRLFEVCKSELKLIHLPECIGHTNFNLKRDIAFQVVELILRVRQLSKSTDSNMITSPVIEIPEFCRAAPSLPNLRKSKSPKKLNSLGCLEEDSLRHPNPKTMNVSQIDTLVSNDLSLHPPIETCSIVEHKICREQVEKLSEMGFPNCFVEDAIQWANGDIDLALDILLSSYI